LTGIKQNFSRKNSIPINLILFEFELMDIDERHLKEKPAENGAYINGLYLEGARWCRYAKSLRESHEKVMFDHLPVIWVRPIEKNLRGEVAEQPRDDLYECPVYKTTVRQGLITSVGYSTNFVLNIDFPTDVESGHWIDRGKGRFFYLIL
jgi:dynein heavy chain